MQVGIIGLGRMGANMAERWLRGGHDVLATSRSLETLERARERGLECVDTPAELVAGLATPRVVWLMVPAGEATDNVLAALTPHLAAGDTIVDGGNSYYRDTLRRAEALKDTGLHYVDCGVSGGVWGLEEGYSLMVGGEEAVVAGIRPLLETLAPAPDRGWSRVGPVGSGHFVKMVHNGIEYGMMQALAEGFAVMERKAEFGLDLEQVAQTWQYGSVVRSWLLDLVARALADDASLDDVAPYVADSGEGRWTVQEALDLEVSAPIITLSLLQRVRSRDERDYVDRLLAVMRQQFGGHPIKREESPDARPGS
jgi:6-phosphogluconate dehydrogenase